MGVNNGQPSLKSVPKFVVVCWGGLWMLDQVHRVCFVVPLVHVANNANDEHAQS